jgi:hypothetical protein
MSEKNAENSKQDVEKRIVMEHLMYKEPKMRLKKREVKPTQRSERKYYNREQVKQPVVVINPFADEWESDDLLCIEPEPYGDVMAFLNNLSHQTALKVLNEQQLEKGVE